MVNVESDGECPECSGAVRTSGTELVCTDCGLVVDEDAIDPGPEWRSFEDDTTDRRRTGAPLTRARHDRGLSTEIGFGTGSDDSSTQLSGRKRTQLARLRREHNRARISSKADGNQVYGFTEIDRITASLSLPDSIEEQACVLFGSAQSEGLLQGRSLEGFAAAAVYATCRARSNPRTVSEVVTAARADADELKVAYDALNRELGLPTGPIDPAQYLPRFASELEVTAAVERRAHELVSALQDRQLVGGRNPSGVAAACLYTASSECDEQRSLTQAAVAEVADVAPVTIRSTVTLLREVC